MKSQAQTIMRGIRYLDCLLLAVSGSVAWTNSDSSARLNFVLLLLLIPIHSSLLQYFGLYESHRIDGLRQLIRNLISAQLVAAMLILAVPIVNGQLLIAASAAAYLAISFIVILVERVVLYGFLRILRTRGFDVRNVCMIGEREDAEAMQLRFAENASWGMRLEYVGTSGKFFRVSSGECVQGQLEDLLRTEPVDEVLISAQTGQIDHFKTEMKLCEEYGVTARFILRSQTAERTHDAHVEDFLGGVALTLSAKRSEPMALAVKRAVDIIVAAGAIVLLSPVFAILCVLIKLSSQGSIFFRQHRVGRNGRRFTIYKFRTMIPNAEELLPTLASRNITQGPVFKSSADWRITPVGRWLRRFSLDELPQFFNVLKGDMSLVGPRPLPIHEAQAVSGPFRRRFTMRPGITCFWQVSGRSDIGFVRWMNMDLEYIDTWSLWLDTKLLVETIPAVITGRGAY
jgi:exopolysaccharide biosynthesis polyprenyl glycosylphosphotransferase